MHRSGSEIYSSHFGRRRAGSAEAVPDMKTSPHQENDERRRGYGWFLAAVFVVGETAGSGMVAMPRAVMNTGLFGGITLLLLLCGMLAYTAYLLGENWLLMQRRWPQYISEPCRDPYPEMARRAMGPQAKLFAQILIYATLFCAVGVFSLLAAKNFTQLLTIFDVHLHFCVVFFAIALFIWPFMMLRSPMHFWQVSIGAAASTTTAVILILIGVSQDLPTCLPEASYSETNIIQFSLGFGTIVFAYGGHPVFPTIQNDMRKASQFSWAVIASYTLLLILYIPVSLSAYLTYGNSMSDSVISSIQTPLLRNIINVMITLHVLLSILIIANPLSQGAEQLFHVKHEFGIGRVIVRSSVYWAAIFTAATIPNFGIFLDLVGASSMTLLCVVLPGVFALYLETGEKLAEERKTNCSIEESTEDTASFGDVIRQTHKGRLLSELVIIGIGLCCGTIATVNAVYQMFQSSFSTPCYIQLFQDSGSAAISTGFRCCGAFGNVTHLSDVTCINQPPYNVFL